MDLELTITYDRDGDWWLARVLEIPGARSQGRSLEEAREMALDAARELGLVRRDEGLREGAGEIETLRALINVPSAT